MQDDINDFVLELHIENVSSLTEEEYSRLNDIYPGRSREELLDLYQQLIGYFNTTLKVYLRLKREGKWEAVAEELRGKEKHVGSGKGPVEIARPQSEPQINEIVINPEQSTKRPRKIDKKLSSAGHEQSTLF